MLDVVFTVICQTLEADTHPRPEFDIPKYQVSENTLIPVAGIVSHAPLRLIRQNYEHKVY